MSDDKGVRRLRAAIKITGGDDGFRRIHQKRLFAAPAAHFLAAAQFQVTAQFQPARDSVQMRGANQAGLQHREFAFLGQWAAAEKNLAHHQAKDGLAEESHLLVAAHRGSTAAARFAGQGTMGKRAAQQFRVGKPMLQFQLKKCGLRAHEGRNYFASPPPGALPPALTAAARIEAATDLICACTSGIAVTLSHNAMASSFLPADCSADASRTMYAGSGRELASTALLNAAAAASSFFPARLARPIPL